MEMTEKRCPHNRFVNCSTWNPAACSRCGWNPTVTEKRKKDIEKERGQRR